MKVFAVKMIRLGSDHNYLAGIFSSEAKAEEAGIAVRKHRDSKYDYEVHQLEVEQNSSNEYFVSLIYKNACKESESHIIGAFPDRGSCVNATNREILERKVFGEEIAQYTLNESILDSTPNFIKTLPPQIRTLG